MSAETTPVHTVTLPNGETVASNMTPQERFALVAKSTTGVTVTAPQAQPQFHTEGTARRLQRGDAEAAIDRKAVEALGKAFSTLDARNRETHRAAYEADLRALYAGQRSPGNLAAALDKAIRDNRVQTALTKALAENKSPAELKAILDGALTGTAPKVVAPPQGTPEERARDASGRFVASQYTPEQWAEGHKSVTNEHGNIPLERINPEALSGYKLHALIPNQHYSVATFAALATARKAGISQEQVDAYFREQMKADGWLP